MKAVNRSAKPVQYRDAPPMPTVPIEFVLSEEHCHDRTGRTGTGPPFEVGGGAREICINRVGYEGTEELR
jgi:hypothetical protein